MPASSSIPYAVYHFNFRQSGWSEKHFLNASSFEEAVHIGDQLGRWRIASCAKGTLLAWARLSFTDTPQISIPLPCIDMSSTPYFGPERTGPEHPFVRLHYRFETAAGNWSDRLIGGIPDAVVADQRTLGNVTAWPDGEDMPDLTDVATRWSDVFRGMLRYVRLHTLYAKHIAGSDPSMHLYEPWQAVIYRKVAVRDTGRDFLWVSWEPAMPTTPNLPGGDPAIAPAFSVCGQRVGVVRSAYMRPCRWYGGGGTGVIRYYFVPRKNPVFKLPTVFWPYSQDLVLKNVLQPGELSALPYKWHRGFRHVGLDLVPHGTPDDFLGQGSPLFDATGPTPTIYIVRCGMVCEIKTIELTADEPALNIEEADIIRLHGPNNVQVQGILDGQECRRCVIWNIHAANTIRFKLEADEATAIDRMLFGVADFFDLLPLRAVEIWYDTETARWRLEIWGSGEFDLTVMETTGDPPESVGQVGTLKLDDDAGFEISEPEDGVAAVTLKNAASTQTGVVNKTTQQMGGAKTFAGDDTFGRANYLQVTERAVDQQSATRMVASYNEVLDYGSGALEWQSGATIISIGIAPVWDETDPTFPTFPTDGGHSEDSVIVVGSNNVVLGYAHCAHIAIEDQIRVSNGVRWFKGRHKIVEIPDGPTLTFRTGVLVGTGLTTPAECEVTAAPTSVLANGVATTTITVIVRDEAGTPIPGQTIVVTAGGSSAIVAPASAVTDSGGECEFTATDIVVEEVTFNATNTTQGEPVGASNPVDFIDPSGIADPGESDIIAAPTIVVADGVDACTITVTVRDFGGSPLSGKTVTLASSSANPDITPASDTTDGSGQVIFSATNETIEDDVTFTATVVDDTVDIGPSNTVDFVDASIADAGESAIEVDPTEVFADGVDATAITVTVRNAAGDPLSGKTVTVAADAGDAVVAPASDVTDGAGEANFTATNTTIETSTFTASVVADSVDIGPSDAVDFVTPPTELGPIYAGTVSAETHIAGSFNWNNAANAEDAEDGIYADATETPAPGSISHWLRLHDFPFSLPSGKEITGIRIEVLCADPNAGSINFNGTTTADATPSYDIDFATPGLPTTLDWIEVGGPYDTLDKTWDTDDLNDGEWSIWLSLNVLTTDVATIVDAVRVTVWYVP